MPFTLSLDSLVDLNNALLPNCCGTVLKSSNATQQIDNKNMQNMRHGLSESVVEREEREKERLLCVLFDLIL